MHTIQSIMYTLTINMYKADYVSHFSASFITSALGRSLPYQFRPEMKYASTSARMHLDVKGTVYYALK